MNLEKLKRHSDILRKSIHYRKKISAPLAVDNLQFYTFDFEGTLVLHIEGSNERKDIPFNLLYFGIFFHLGYVLLTHKIKNLFSSYKSLIVICHSLGAGVGSILYWPLGKRCKEAILLGCPPSYTWINPLYPRRMTNYRVKGDLVPHANILRPVFRHAVIPTVLPKQSDDVIKNHSVESYLAAMEEIIF
jgi:hypothetical protein